MVSSSLDRTREIIRNDLDPEFVAAFAVAMPWAYDQLYESLSNKPGIPDTYTGEEYSRRRNLCAVECITKAAKTHGIPFDFRRLDCNGQYKMLVKAGRVLLIQEPMISLTENPRTSDYKRELASTYGLVRQLELDLGDQPQRIHDWSGCVLGVVLHGPAGPKFTREDKALGGLMLAVPDAKYESWDVRLDLHRIALFGLAGAEPFGSDDPAPDDQPVQRDEVRVTLRKKRLSGRGTG